MVLKKRSKKKRVWTCTECKDGKGKTPCKHLEKLLNPVRKEPMFESVYKYAGSKTEPVLTVSETEQEFQFVRKLRAMKLDPILSDILILRFIYDLTFSEITKELGLLNVTTTMKLYAEAATVVKKDWRPKK